MQEPPELFTNGVYLDKPLPSSEDSERLILGSSMLDNTLIDSAIGVLTPEDFYSPLHKKVYAAMVTLREAQKTIDPILIAEELKKDGDITAFGGITTISGLMHGLPFISDLSEYITLVKDKAKLRALIRMLSHLQSQALSEETDASQVIEYAESQVYGLSEGAAETGFVHVREPIDESIELAHARSESGSDIVGLRTGLIELDQKLQGLRRGHHIIVAARPSIGKTALMGTICNHSALRENAVIAVFSIEMSKEEMMDRLLCSEAGIDGYRYTSGQVRQDEWEKVEETRAAIQTREYYIDDTANIGTSAMRAKLRRLQNSLDRPIDLVCIDYLQLMGGDEKHGREREVSKMSRELKIMAREFDVPVVTLSQLNRNSENRANHRPTMADLRESGAIEQDADVIIFIYREDYYQEAPSLYTNEAELIIGKNRKGATGIVKVRYDAPATKFTNLAREGDY